MQGYEVELKWQLSSVQVVKQLEELPTRGGVMDFLLL